MTATRKETAPDDTRAPAEGPRPPQEPKPPGRVAVVAHRRKSLGGGLDELRRRISDAGIDELRWYEVPKSRKAAKAARRAAEEGAELVFVWGGDGTVQRCVDALAGTDIPLAILPAGTANQLAGALGIPADLAEAVRIGLSGRRRQLDLGRINGEHFAVMAGVGFDAEMISDTDRAAKNRLGRLAYVRAAARHTGGRAATRVRIKVDGTTWFSGNASCVLLGNVGTLSGLHVFDHARPDDGWLDIGVTTAVGRVQWARAMTRIVAGRAERSPLIRVTRARKVTITLADPTRYEVDGGARGKATRLKARVAAGAITICVPD